MAYIRTLPLFQTWRVQHDREGPNVTRGVKWLDYLQKLLILLSTSLLDHTEDMFLSWPRKLSFAKGWGLGPLPNPFNTSEALNILRGSGKSIATVPKCSSNSKDEEDKIADVFQNSHQYTCGQKKASFPNETYTIQVTLWKFTQLLPSGFCFEGKALLEIYLMQNYQKPWRERQTECLKTPISSTVDRNRTIIIGQSFLWVRERKILYFKLGFKM